jgi:hypothetical protein
MNSKFNLFFFLQKNLNQLFIIKYFIFKLNNKIFTHLTNLMCFSVIVIVIVVFFYFNSFDVEIDSVLLFVLYSLTHMHSNR